MTQLHFNDLSTAEADVIIIPQSTAGTMSGNFLKFAESLGIATALQQCELGNITLVPLNQPKPFKYVALATSVNENTSSYGAIYRIVRNLSSLLPSDVKSIALPMLGTGAGQLSGLKIWQLLVKSLDEFLPDTECHVYTLEKNLSDSVKSLPQVASNAPAVRLALDFMVEDIRGLEWVKEMMHMREFYFELAKEQFIEYLQWNDDGVNFKVLLSEFTSAKTVFSKYITKFEQDSAVHNFLEICGRLVSYIDRHAFNKKKWNRYADKRTMALSNVNQTRWIENLIRFRASANDHSVLTPSVRNAFAYLRQPSETLTMLSNNHRAKVSKTFFNAIDLSNLLTELGKYFNGYSIKCANSENDGHLYTRILYAPEIKALWSTDVDGKQDEDLVMFQDVKPENNTPITSDVAKLRNIKQLMYSDLYASTDLLNYEAYASIIARLITSNLSQPPFNISILAPWGKGKTSLMRFIERQISNKTIDALSTKERPVSSLLTLQRWLSNTQALFTNLKKLDHPVIWFNAWKFQKNEQVWAGLADEIIRQLANQLDPVHREKFWLKLNIKRVDRDKLKREIWFKILGKYVWPLVYTTVALVFSCLIFIFDLGKYLNFQNETLRKVIASMPFLAAAGFAYKQIVKSIKKPAELEVGKFLLQPEYRQKMGYLQSVEDDLRQAISLVINENKPAVIFIDDLDRCSPNVIVDVVEAINAFMSGDLSNCYFIIGQDPQMVIASLDSAYEKIAGKIGKLENNSIGRFFLEKFSQLSINIPILSEAQRQRFVETLLAGLDEESIPNNAHQDELLNEYRNLELELDSLDDPESIFNKRKDELEAKIRLFKPERVSEFQEKILNFAFKSYTLDDNELDNIVADVSDYLDSPRTIKRFINLFLFYRFYKFTTAGRMIAAIDEPLFSRWLVLMVRWPMLCKPCNGIPKKNFYPVGMLWNVRCILTSALKMQWISIAI